MRIKKASYYVLADHPGISGFKDYSRKVETIVTGYKAARERNLVQREFFGFTPGRRFELHDGHLPGHRPIVSPDEAISFLDQNPFQCVSLVAPVAIVPQSAPCPVPQFRAVVMPMRLS